MPMEEATDTEVHHIAKIVLAEKVLSLVYFKAIANYDWLFEYSV